MHRMTFWRRAMRRANALLMIGAVTLAGCDGLVEYEERDVLDPGALNNAAGAQALYAGALRDWGQAFTGNNGGTEGQALISGMMSDEWFHSGTFSTRVDFDMRSHFLDNSTLLGVFRNLQTARLGADRAVAAMAAAGAAEASDARFGQMYNIIGGAFLMGAMNYCSGIPYSSVVDGVLVPGDQLTTAQMQDSANFYFDKALAAAAGTNSVNHNTAKLMKGRILMLKGPTNFAAAATMVAGVPTTFRATIEHSTINGGTENGIFVFNVQNERWSIAHREGVNGLPFRGAGDGTNSALADPRVPWKRDGGTDVGFDNTSPQYDLLIYSGRASPSYWGKGEEARLIEAEADLQANNTGGWLTKLNALRAGVAGLAPLADPGTTAGRVDLMMSERAFWLYVNGTRLSDMRRMVRQYGRSANSVFPTGAYPKGGSYGPDMNFAVPDQENQNPKYSSGIVCLDRGA